MTGGGMRPKKDDSDEEPMKTLFGEEIMGLCDDGFEGSNDECRIFMEILYRNDTGNASKRRLASSAVKFELEESDHSNALTNTNCKNLAGVSLASMKESLGNDVGPANEHFDCSSVKCMKLSDRVPSNEDNESSYCLSDFWEEPFQSKQSKEVAYSGHAPDFVYTGETIPCHLVESCSEGIISSRVVLRPHGEIDFIDDADDRKTFNKIKAASPVQKYVKKVWVSKTLVSQESSVSRLLLNRAVTTIEEVPVAPILPNEGSKESDILRSGTADATSNCVPSGQQRETDILYEADGGKASNRKRAVKSIGKYVEELSALKDVRPGLQESSLSDVFLDGTVTATEEVPVTSSVVKEGHPESGLIELGVADVTSGCLLLRQQREANTIDEADYGIVSNTTEVTNHPCEYAEELIASKAVMNSTSQESSVLKLFSNNTIDGLEEATLVPVAVKQVPDESFFLKLDTANVISLSGSDLLSRCRETDIIYEADDEKASNNTELSTPHGECIKEVTLSETRMPPFSQESSVSKLLPNAAIAGEEIPIGRSQESDLSKSGDAIANSRKDFQFSLCTHDHKQMNHAESSRQDVLSSCVPLKQCRKMDARDEIDDKKASNKTKKARPHERSVKKVPTPKAIISTVSPKSSASLILLNGVVARNELKPVASTVAKEGSQESDLLSSDMANVASKEHSNRNLRTRSRKHIDLVESSSQGAMSSCTTLKRCREDTAEVASPCGSDDEKADKLKAIKLSDSQESLPSNHLLTGAICAIKEMPRALEGVKEGSQEVDFLITGMVDEASKEDFIRSLRPRLREHISLVLEAAGWDVVIRERGHRPSYFDTLFATPKQKLICKLPKAWKSCGKSLFSGGIHRVQKENMWEWVHINNFWDDLSITLAYIEKQMQDTETSLSLAKRWCLLDPFVIMVCIDRRIGVLRSGKAVKVVNGVSIVSETPLRSKRRYGRKNLHVAGDQVVSSNESFGQVPESAIMSNQMDSCFSITQPVTKYLERKRSPSVSKRKLALSGDANITGMMSSSPPSEDMLLNVPVAQESAILFLEPSKSQDLKSDESVFMNRTIGCMTEGELVPFDLNVETEGMDRQPEVKQRTNKRVMRSGRTQKCEQKDDVLTQDTIQDNVMIPKLHSLFQSNPNLENLRQSSHLHDLIGSAFEESNSELKYASTAVQGIAPVEEMRKPQKKKNGHTRKKLKSMSEVKTSKSVSKQKKAALAEPPSVESQSSNFINLDSKQEDFAPGDLKKSRKFYGSMIASVHNGKLLMANPQSECSIAEQQMSFLFPHENVCRKVDGNCQEDVLARGKIQPDKNVSCLDSEIENSLNLSVHQVKTGIAFASKFARGVASARGREIAKMVLDDGPDIGLTKRSKKSRKISEIKASKSNSEHEPGSLIPQEVDSQDVDFINSNEVHHGLIHGHFRSQKYLMGKGRKGSAKTSISPSQFQSISSSKLKKFQHLGSDVKEFSAVKRNVNSQIQLKCENDIYEASVRCATDESVDPQAKRKFPKMKKTMDHDENGRKGLRACPIDDDDLLIAAIIKNKDFSSNNRPKAARKLKTKKSRCKLLVRSLGKGGKMDMKFSMGTRTVLSRLLDAGVVSMDDVIQYRSPKDGAVIKDGRVTRDGIFCKCCNKMLSVSEFKIHAGFKQHRPCLHLFLGSGKPFTLCQLQAWSSEYKVRKSSIKKVVDEVDQNDDTCGICGDGGELICCDNCPSTFHQSCLFAQELPDGNWYCSNCTCGICGKLVNETEASSSLVGSQCPQCEHKYHMTCVNGEHTHKEAVSDPWFCGGNCQKVYSGLHSRIGVLNNISDGFSWILLRCIHGDQKVYSAQRVALMAECNIKLAVALSIMEECFVPMVDPRTGINMIPHVLYNWGSEFARLNYQGFYAVVLEKDDKIISVASIRVHGVTVAEMPLIATCSEHRRMGMCRRLMNAIEEMLKSFKVQMLVISAIPNLVDTWTLGFGFKPIDEKEREKLINVNLMVFPGTMLLIKSLNGMEPVETKQNGMDVELSLQIKESREKHVCNETNSLGPRLQCNGADLIENSALQSFRDSQLEESDCQLKHSTWVSSGELSATHGGSVHEDLSSLDCCSVREGVGPMNLCDASQLVSTKSIVSSEMSAAIAISTVSSDLPAEEICDAYVGKIAEAHSGIGLVAGAVDANSVSHSDVASHKDETINLADGELNQLQSISIMRQSSNHEGTLCAPAGMNFSADKAPVACANELFVNSKVGGSHFSELNKLHPLQNNHSHPHGNSVDFMEAVATTGGKVTILVSRTGYSNAHVDSTESTHLTSLPEVSNEQADRIISCLLEGESTHLTSLPEVSNEQEDRIISCLLEGESTHLTSLPEVSNEQEDRIISCLLEGDHEQRDNASGQEPKSPGLTQKHRRNQDNEVDAFVDTASEKYSNNQKECCFTSSTKLDPSILVKPVCQAPSPKISIQASGHN